MCRISEVLVLCLENHQTCKQLQRNVLSSLQISLRLQMTQEAVKLNQETIATSRILITHFYIRIFDK